MGAPTGGSTSIGARKPDISNRHPTPGGQARIGLFEMRTCVSRSLKGSEVIFLLMHSELKKLHCWPPLSSFGLMSVWPRAVCLYALLLLCAL